MLTIHSQRKIKLFAVEKPTVWLVFAAVVEVRGEETILVSEPRLVKIKQKEVLTLNGKQTQRTPLLISAPIRDIVVPNAIVSPYCSYEVTKDPNLSVWYNARPPTVYA